MRSIRRQLTWQLGVMVVVLVGVGLTAVYSAVRHELIKAIDSTLRARATAVAALSEFENGHVEFDFSREFLSAYPTENPRRFFEVRNAAGQVLARSPSLGDADLPSRSSGTAAQPKCYDVELPNGRPGRAASLEFSLPSEVPRGSRVLQIVEAVDRTELIENLRRILVATVGCGMFLVAAVCWLVPRILRRGLLPLDALGAQTEKIDVHSLGTRFAADTLPAELQPIGHRMNDLLARLESSFERERRFSADLAHELRTPLAELRNLAECALKWPEARDPDLDKDVLAIALQMESLATRMLTLARGEHGQMAVTVTSFDVVASVRESWEPYADRAAARGVHAVFDLVPSSVWADRVLLHSILTNLFANATEYAPNQSEIRINGELSNTGYTLRVANPANALDQSDVEQIFDRFWRKELSRTGGDHAGLGLNLARVFASSMGWKLTASLETAGWLTFTLAETSPAPSAIGHPVR